MLVEDRGQVRFGDIVSEARIKEHACGFTNRGKFLVPCDNTKGQRISVSTTDGFVQTHEEGTGTDGVDLFGGDQLLFDGYCQIKSKLEEKFVEDVCL